MQATATALKPPSGPPMFDCPAGVCITDAGERAIARRYRELGRPLTKAEVRELLVPTVARRTLRLRA